MNPRERFLRTLRGRPADRVPLLLQGFQVRGREAIGRHPVAAWREVAERVFGLQTYRVGVPSRVNRWFVTPPRRIREVRRRSTDAAETVTWEIDTPGGPLSAVTGRNPATDTTWTVKYPVESPEDLEKIRSVPWEPPEDPALPHEADLPADFHQRGILETRISSPFVCAAGMMPYQAFLELCATDPARALDLTEQCHRRVLDVLDGLLAPGRLEYVWIGGSEWLTPPMASPGVYDALVQPFEREMIERAHAAGALAHVHCHGNVRSTLERVIARGADYFEPVEPPPDGDLPLSEAKGIAAGRITLGGNVEARLIAREGPDAVERAVEAAFEGGRRRLVLQTTAGPIGPVTPEVAANYHRLVDAWERLACPAEAGRGRR